MAENIKNVTPNNTSLHVMKEKNMNQVNKTAKVMKVLGYIAVYAFLAFMAVIVLFPFYWMLISSVKDIYEYNRSVPTLWPEVIHFGNYVRALEAANLERVFLNTVYVGIVSTILSLVITVLSAFAFARQVPVTANFPAGSKYVDDSFYFRGTYRI